MKRYLSIFFMATVFLVSFYGLSFSCDYCQLSQGLSPLQSTTGMGLRVDERYVVLDKMYNGTQKVDNPGNKETHLVTQFTGFYSVNPDLTVLAVVPYARRTMKEWHEHHHDEMELVTGDASGVGDITLAGRYAFFRRHDLDSTTILAGLAGAKLPTGSTNARDDAGRYMDAHVQPGTGSVDVLLGLNFNHAVDRFTLASNALFSVNNEGKTGNAKHQFGNQFAYDVTGLYRIHPATPPGQTLSLALGVAGEWRDKEKIAGVAPDGLNGHVIYLNTGLWFMPHPQWIMELNYRPAVYHNLPASPSSAQLGEDYKVTLSLTTLFR